MATKEFSRIVRFADRIADGAQPRSRIELPPVVTDRSRIVSAGNQQVGEGGIVAQRCFGGQVLGGTTFHPTWE